MEDKQILLDNISKVHTTETGIDNVNIKFTKMDRLIFTNLDRII